ncbi:MAG: c-type cytochrome [Alphaproteobacteria bacterium]|nr:c-type cytochrome [Alphaproteobacteria bacterium]
MSTVSRVSLLLALALTACGTEAPPAPEPAPKTAEKSSGDAVKHAALFAPLPEHMHRGEVPPAAMIDLGRQLYYDARLSKNHDIACNSCHALDAWGVDNEPTSPGHKGVRGGRNSPTSYNAALHVAQFWDGRAADVEEQAKGPVLNPVEMAMPDGETVVGVLKTIPGYEAGFAAAFPGDADPITYDHVAAAIGAFERGLVTPAPFDAYLGGDADALTAQQKQGLDTFVETGCVTCHSGVALGGHMYQKLGLVKPYETADQGRFDLTQNEADRYMFKVPSLRNTAKTGPWFHDGSVATLDDAVRKMAWHQLGKELTDAQVADIVAFLDSLTGELPKAYIAKPELPPSGPKTPAPDPS